MDLKQLRLSTGTIRYRDEGPADGPVLVFVHGFLVDGTLWRKVTPLLTPWARCITPDWPMGSHVLPMDPGADLSPHGVAGLIAEFLEALDLDEVTIVGNDSGGALSQVLVTEHPKRVGRLVLTPCDAFENFPPKLFRPMVKAARGPKSVLTLLAGMKAPAMRRAPFAFGWLSKHGIPDEVTEAWVTPALQDAAIRRDVAKVLQGLDPAVTLAAADKLGGFDKPALLVWAAEDKFFPLEHAERLAALLPDARVEIVEDSWSFVSEDQPQRLADLLYGFAGAQPAGKVPAGTSPA
ncbi:MAG: alpha/beta fold hydrolase [Solirubrobacteraceae bacterium]